MGYKEAFFGTYEENKFSIEFQNISMIFWVKVSDKWSLIWAGAFAYSNLWILLDDGSLGPINDQVIRHASRELFALRNFFTYR